VWKATRFRREYLTWMQDRHSDSDWEHLRSTD